MRPLITPSHTQQAASNSDQSSSYGLVRDKLDISPKNLQTRKELLRNAIFPNWRDDASGSDLGQPDEMARKDPIGIQMWKLYSRTKTQLPNQERLDNLTWRMMAMNLKRKQREQARFVPTWRPLPVQGVLLTDLKTLWLEASKPPALLLGLQSCENPVIPPMPILVRMQ
ncbi:MAG: hypothetical protein Q9217_005409 [Psora testacea]